MLREWIKMNYLKRYYGQTLEVNADVADQNQDGLTGKRKTQGNWVVEIGWQLPRIGVAGDICLRRPRPTQGCRADDDESHASTNVSGYDVLLPEELLLVCWAFITALGTRINCQCSPIHTFLRTIKSQIIQHLRQNLQKFQV